MTYIALLSVVIPNIVILGVLAALMNILKVFY
jgi:hypothetical protein